jgi:hypothetical protein
VIEDVKGDEFMLEDDDEVESLNFKSKLEELLDGLGDFVKVNLRINKNRVKEALTQFSHALILWPERRNVYNIFITFCR